MAKQILGGTEGRPAAIWLDGNRRHAFNPLATWSRRTIMHRITFPLIGSLLALFTLVGSVSAQIPAYLQFDGVNDYVQVDSSPDFSVDDNSPQTSPGLTVSAWIRPDTLTFSDVEGSLDCEKFVHWLGKGDVSGASGNREWVFRMYSLNPDCQPNPRQNRISFYVFNPGGGLGTGSYFQEPVRPGQWIHVVGVVDNGFGDPQNTGLVGNKGKRTYIYKNGKLMDCDQYGGSELKNTVTEVITVINTEGRTKVNCVRDNLTMRPMLGGAPLRIGTRDHASYFQGSIAEVRIWNRPLSQQEVADLYISSTAPDGLVAEYLLNQDTGTDAFDTTLAHHGVIADGRDLTKPGRPPIPGATWVPPCFEGPQRVCGR